MIPNRHELQFGNDPWECKLIREGEIIFHLLTEYDCLHSQISLEKASFRFEHGSLSIRIAEARVIFSWQGQGIRNQIQLLGWWYGGGELLNQPLLWNRISLPLTDFTTCDNGVTGLSTLLNPIWLTSLGVGLIVRSPFALGVNQPASGFKERESWMSADMIPFERRPVIDSKSRGDSRITLVGDDLRFEVLVQDDLVACHRSLIQTIGRPERIPPLELLGAPIWTTWARYKDRIDQGTVLEFAREIRDQGYPFQVLEIDDRWQSRYGELEFDPERFPDPKAMIRELKQMGYKVTVWVIPFFHPDSPAGQEAARQGYVARTRDGEPYLVKWWQGKGYLLDVSHPGALSWFKTRLENFQQEYGLEGFKFDAGEAKFLPADALLHRELPTRNDYSRLYVDWIAANFRFCEARTGWMNQTAPIFFRLWDLWSVWGHDNGLQSIIPSTLSLSLTGYPFLFPDMIGGNAYFTFPKNRLVSWIIHKLVIPILERKLQKGSEGSDDPTLGLADVPLFLQKSVYFGYPTPELMIRWAQANVFLGVMQFSLAPWDFGEECSQICRQAARLHQEFTPALERFTRLAAETGDPVIRPVSWLAPRDQAALVCEDEFLVGDQILAAPVLKPGQRSREIYFPPGTWLDPRTGKLYQGPMTIRSFPAPLEVLPYFIRQEIL